MKVKVAQILSRKEGYLSRVYQTELKLNSNKIINIQTQIQNLNSKQNNFASILGSNTSLAQLIHIHGSIKQIASQKKSAQQKLLILNQNQQKLSVEIKHNEFKLDKLNQIVDKDKLQKEEIKNNRNQEELLQCVHYNHFGIQPINATNNLSVNSNILPTPISDPSTHYRQPVEVSVNGTLKLNDNQSLEVNLRAVDHQSCGLKINACSSSQSVNQEMSHHLKSNRESILELVRKNGVVIDRFEVNSKLRK